MGVPQWKESVMIQRVEKVIFTLKDLTFSVGGNVREIKKITKFSVLSVHLAMENHMEGFKSRKF